MAIAHFDILNLVPCLIPAVREEISSLATKLVFGSSLDLDLLGIEIDEGTLIPGLAVASSRAKPLAGAYLLYRFLMLFLLSFMQF